MSGITSVPQAQKAVSTAVFESWSSGFSGIAASARIRPRRVVVTTRGTSRSTPRRASKGTAAADLREPIGRAGHRQHPRLVSRSSVPESWADLLRSCKRRGMVAPVLAAGDGAPGFWAALREVFPETKEQRRWFHKSANVVNCLPKSAQPSARATLTEIWQAEDKDHALAAVKAFETAYGAKWPKATAKITDDVDVLLAFYDYPAEHWVHLRATNPSRRLRPSAYVNTSPKDQARGPQESRWL